MIVALGCLFAFFSLSSSLLAQSPPFYAGSTQTVYSSGTVSGAGDGNGIRTWAISGPSGYFYGGTSGDVPGGWSVTVATGGFTVTAPASTALGKYTLSYATKQTFNNTAQDYVYSGPQATFQIVSPPPPKPAAGNPAFSWQGSVGGVNTGNGNKTTALPIVGWTQRGGMGVSCTLYHSSQGAVYSTAPYGYKWVPSYFSYITGGSSAPVLHWDNGLTYAYTNSNGTYVPPYGILDKLTYSNGIFTLTTTSNTVYTFGFSSGNAYLSSITDMDGNVLTINHNTDATIRSVVDSTGRTLTYTYSGGHLTTVTDPLGRQWGFVYLQSGDLWYVSDPSVPFAYNYRAFAYDGSHDITQMQDHNNNQSYFGYNADSSLAWARDPLGNQTTFTYNPTNTVITDPNGHTTTHTYQYSRLISVTDALNFFSGTSYDYNNIVTSTTDKRGNAAYFSSHFSNSSSTSTSTDPLNHSSSTTYDAKNKVIGSVDALGNSTANAYSTDGKEDLLTTSVTGTGTAPFKAASSVGGYSYGLPTTFTDPLSFSSSVGYDGNGYPNSATDANYHTSSAVFNALGWKMTGTDAASHTTTNTYDNWGRVTAVTAPDNTQMTMTYDPNGNVLTVTDADNHTVTNVYDADNRLIQTTNGRGDVVKYTYDGTDYISGAPQKGLLSSKTDGNGNTIHYTYTARNEPAATYYADGTAEAVTYDANGNTLTRTKADGKVIKYTYDADNRLTDITYPTLHATHFDYDAGGRRTHMSDATGDTYWTFGDGIHLSQQSSSRGSVFYTYDGDGRRKTMVAPGLNPSVTNAPYTYGYDPAGRMTSLQNPFSETTGYAYNPDNTLSSKTLANGLSLVYGYDAADQVNDLHFGSQAGAYGHHYTYTPGGSLASRSESDGGVNTFGYDGADQLVSETRTGPVPFTHGYTYDHNGNRLTQTQNGVQVQSFSYNGHDVMTSGINETPSWDYNGNEIGDTLNGQHTTYTYDDEDRMTSVTLPDGHTDSYTYNGLGLRLTKSDPSGSYAYFTDGTSPASDVLSDNFSSFTPGTSETKGIGNGQYASLFYAPDAQGNSRGLLNGSQAATDGYNWDAFGTLMSRFGSNPTAYAWGEGSGYQSDADTGLVLLGHRYYDTRLGRFISQDHAKSGGNWYAYCNNNPMNKTDPSGLAPPDGPGSSPVGSPGYSGTGGGGNGYGEDDSESYENNQQVDQNIADHATAIFNAGAAIEEMLGAIAPQLADWTGSISYGGSISLGTVRFTGAVGAAYDFATGKIEFFRQYGVFAGYGSGMSTGLGITLGNDKLGNFGGFNGQSFNIDGLLGGHGSGGYEWNANYSGGEFSPPGELGGPFRFTQYGNENGGWFGSTNTIPFGPSPTLKLPTVTTLQF